MPKKSEKAISGTKKSFERVMVVKRDEIFADGIWRGIKTANLQKYLNIISTRHKFLPRSEVEENPHWQQIIPYLIFEKGDKIFLMRRKSDHTDKRLANMYSIGVGGHVNKKDMGSRNIMNWAKREFEEEISYEGHYKSEFLGLINDDSNDVGLVHLGLVIKISGDSDNISIKDEHKSGSLESLSKIGAHYKHMETWSQIVYDFLSDKMKKPKNLKIRAKKISNNISGILPDWLIADFIEKGVIKISSLSRDWRKNIDQVSIDFHLGNKLKLFRAGAYRFVDTRRGLPNDAMEEVSLEDGDPFILEPGAFAIASTREVLKLPDDILGRLEGKSSLARLGILVHSTAARFDPGWNGAPVLELGNLGPT